jgi:transposase
MVCVPAGHRGEAWLEKGLLCSKQRCPSSLIVLSVGLEERAVLDVVVIGVDPHKRSVTVEARDVREVLRATGSFPTTAGGYRAMLTVARQWPKRLWAVEGAGGVGRPLAARLLADGERVLDVPAKLSARVRVFDVGHGRKTDATDAHAVVLAALRDRNQLRELSTTEDLVVLRLLADRRDELSRSRAQGLNRLHRLMPELVPGGIPVKKSVPQYQAMLARVRPRDVVGRTVRRLAADQLADLVRLDARLKALKTELRDAVLASGSHLMDLPGIGPAGAARILADVGDVRRFPDRNHFASRPAPLPSTRPPASRSVTGSPAPGTAG